MEKQSLIYVIDDDPAMVESLCWVIESIDLNVKAYTNAQVFLEEYHPQVPGCILLDARMPDISGPELQVKLNALREKGVPVQPIIFMSGHGDIPLTVRVMKAGAIDFLMKPFNDQVLLETINKAIRFDRETRALRAKHADVYEKFALLSSREAQVLHGIVDGKPNKVISADLNISLKTVEAHRASLMKKMRVKSVSELVKMVLSNTHEYKTLCKIDTIN